MIRGILVVPLVGPSSILLSLMASGMNGQKFAFIGYLPVKPAERNAAIRDLERISGEDKQTQFSLSALPQCKIVGGPSCRLQQSNPMCASLST